MGRTAKCSRRYLMICPLHGFRIGVNHYAPFVFPTVAFVDGITRSDITVVEGIRAGHGRVVKARRRTVHFSINWPSHSCTAGRPASELPEGTSSGQALLAKEVVGTRSTQAVAQKVPTWSSLEIASGAKEPPRGMSKFTPKS